MGRLLRYLFLLGLLAAAVGAVYTLFAELPPPTRTVVIEIDGAAIE